MDQTQVLQLRNVFFAVLLVKKARVHGEIHPYAVTH